MILNEFFNLPQVFEKNMTEGVMSEIDAELRNIVANEDFDALYELFSANTPAGRYVQDMYDDVVIDAGLHPDDDFERIEQIVFDRLADDFGGPDMAEGAPISGDGGAVDNFKQQMANRTEVQYQQNLKNIQQGVEEGIFGSRPSPVLPIVDKIAKVARGLNPQNVETGKQIIQANVRDITRMLSPQIKAGVDVIEQGVDEGEDNIPQQRTDKIRERFGRSFARKYAKELAEKVFAEHPKLTSYNLVQRYAFAIAIQELGSRQRLNWLMYDTDFASDILDAYVKLRGLPPIKQGVAEDGPVTIGSRLPKSDIETFGLEPSRGYKINNPKDWKQGDRPRAVQQLIPTQDKKDHIRSRLGKHVDPVLPEAKDDYVPPKEAKYGPEYQAMVRRVGEKARAQEKAKQQQQPKAPVRESRLALLKQIVQS